MISKIQHLKVTEESKKLYPLFKSSGYKEVWYLREAQKDLKKGSVVGAILENDEFVAYDEYKKSIKSLNRSKKLKRINKISNGR